jgi:hypothetical protein
VPDSVFTVGFGFVVGALGNAGQPRRGSGLQRVDLSFR